MRKSSENLGNSITDSTQKTLFGIKSSLEGPYNFKTIKTSSINNGKNIPNIKLLMGDSRIYIYNG